MKIIKHGQIPTPPKPFWVGRRSDCSFCGCEVELEEGDKPEILLERHPQGKRVVTTTCPDCDNYIFFLPS